MACTLTQGISLGDCLIGTGGVKNISIGVFDKSANYTVDLESGTANTFYSYEAGTGGALVLHTFEQDIEIATATESAVMDRATGTRFFEQSVAIQINFGKDATTNDELITLIDEVTKSIMIVFVEDNNGAVRMYGATGGLKATESTGGTGQAFGDLNGITLTLSGKEPLPAPLAVINSASAPTGTAAVYPAPVA